MNQLFSCSLSCRFSRTESYLSRYMQLLPCQSVTVFPSRYPPWLAYYCQAIEIVLSLALLRLLKQHLSFNFLVGIIFAHCC